MSKWSFTNLAATGYGSKPAPAPVPAKDGRKVLNVGGNDKRIPIPQHYAGWQHDLLDIDAAAKPDVLCDARLMAERLPGGSYDAVYCSHNLEHYFVHDAKKVLQGFAHILKPDGFAEIIVPDIGAVMRLIAQFDLDLSDGIIESPAGEICGRDIIYGWAQQIEQSGNDFFAHKNGFTNKSLRVMLEEAFGFVVTIPAATRLELRALAFRQKPDDAVLARLGADAATVAAA